MVGENQNFSKIPLTQEQIRTLLTSPEGQALIRLLQQDGGKGLQTAAGAIRQGDAEGAKAALSSLLREDQVETLGQKLKERL